MSNLTTEQRAYLSLVETSPVWDSANKADLKARMIHLQSAYYMSDSTMATFLLDLCRRIQEAIRLAATEDSNSLDEEIRLVIAEMTLTAAALTSKQRGKKPL